jgi:hypothetical protein
MATEMLDGMLSPVKMTIMIPKWVQICIDTEKELDKRLYGKTVTRNQIVEGLLIHALSNRPE